MISYCFVWLLIYYGSEMLRNDSTYARLISECRRRLVIAGSVSSVSVLNWSTSRPVNWKGWEYKTSQKIRISN